MLGQAFLAILLLPTRANASKCPKVVISNLTLEPTKVAIFDYRITFFHGESNLVFWVKVEGLSNIDPFSLVPTDEGEISIDVQSINADVQQGIARSGGPLTPSSITQHFSMVQTNQIPAVDFDYKCVSVSGQPPKELKLRVGVSIPHTNEPTIEKPDSTSIPKLEDAASSDDKSGPTGQNPKEVEPRSDSPISPTNGYPDPTSTPEREDGASPDDNSKPPDTNWTPIVVGCVAIVLVILIVIGLAICYYSKRKQTSEDSTKDGNVPYPVKPKERSGELKAKRVPDEAGSRRAIGQRAGQPTATKQNTGSPSNGKRMQNKYCPRPILPSDSLLE